MGNLILCQCKNKPRVTHVYETNGKYLESWSLVVCDKCGAMIPESYMTDGEAIESWNRRAKNGHNQPQTG